MKKFFLLDVRARLIVSVLTACLLPALIIAISIKGSLADWHLSIKFHREAHQAWLLSDYPRLCEQIRSGKVSPEEELRKILNRGKPMVTTTIPKVPQNNEAGFTYIDTHPTPPHQGRFGGENDTPVNNINDTSLSPNADLTQQQAHSNLVGAGSGFGENDKPVVADHRFVPDEQLSKLEQALKLLNCDYSNDAPSYSEYFLKEINRSWSDISKIFIIFLSVAIVVFTLLSTIKLYLIEAHIGWQRLSLVVSFGFAVITFFGTLVLADYIEIETFFIGAISAFAVFPLTMLTLLGCRGLYAWVIVGFRVSDTQPLLTALTPASVIAMTNADRRDVAETNLVPATFWNRLWARAIDLVLAYMVTSMLNIPDWLVSAILSKNESLGPLRTAGLQLISLLASMAWMCIILVAYETWSLSRTGTTLGKMFFSIRVESKEGGKLSSKEAYQRTMKVLSHGLMFTLFLPYLQIWSAWVTYQAIQKTGTTIWDVLVGSHVLQKRIWVLRRYAAILISVVALLTLLVLEKESKNIWIQNMPQVIQKQVG